MYAVIQTGGKQYRVTEGQVLKVETLQGEVGDEIQFTEVLMFAEGEKVQCGTPLLSKASVKATIIDHARHKKVRIIKFRRRKHYMRRAGHRQNYTEVKITAIKA